MYSDVSGGIMWMWMDKTTSTLMHTHRFVIFTAQPVLHFSIIG